MSIGLLLLAAPRPAGADTPGYLLGHPWEKPILDGIAEQDRELKRMQPQALAGKYQRLAARRAETNETVRRYYLLGRAHGKNFESLRAQANQARAERQKADLLKQADGAHGQALQAYREVLALAPKCYFAYHDLGVLELQRARPDVGRAVQYLQHSAALNPRYPSPLRKLALVHQERREFAKVAEILYRLIPLAPNDVVARVTLAGALAELGQLDASRRILDQLLAVDPENIGYLAQKADLDFRGGRVDEAQQQFRTLSEKSPTNLLPLQGYMRCLDWKRKNKKRVTAEEYLWAMQRMLRLERRPDVRNKLKEQIKSIKQQQAEQTEVKRDGKLPGPEDLARILKGPQEEGRYQVIAFLNAVNQPPPKLLLDAVLSRLSAKAEPSARVRALAIEIAGRQLGWGWMPIARLVAAQDRDPKVRLAGIDAIARMADQGANARAGAVLVLGRFLDDSDRSVAAAARLGLLELGNGRLRLEENASDAAHRQAFAKWWAGPQGEDLQIEALRRYADIKDPFVEDVLASYARADSFFVRQAAHEAFTSVAELIATPEGRRWYQGKRGSGFAAFERWIQALPKPAEGRLTRENAAAVEPQIVKWLDARPR
ncbi:MAG: hypothetical protein QNJ98_10045 [Planctomycetota bacterium]|nr:hypothetical protein [Planctomycetota bacterium]